MNLEIKENLPKCKRALRPDQSAHGRLSWCSSTDHNALGGGTMQVAGFVWLFEEKFNLGYRRALRPDQSAHSRLSWCSSTDHNALGGGTMQVAEFVWLFEEKYNLGNGRFVDVSVTKWEMPNRRHGMCWRQSLITSQVKEQPVDMDIIGYLVEPNVRVRR